MGIILEIIAGLFMLFIVPIYIGGLWPYTKKKPYRTNKELASIFYTVWGLYALIGLIAIIS